METLRDTIDQTKNEDLIDIISRKLPDGLLDSPNDSTLMEWLEINRDVIFEDISNKLKRGKGMDDTDRLAVSAINLAQRTIQESQLQDAA